MDNISQDLYINDDGFVFDYRAGVSYHLNQPGLFIFKKLLAETPVPEIILVLEKKYGISHNMAAIDTKDFLAQMSGLNLIGAKKLIVDD
jgi:hypothetical protein